MQTFTCLAGIILSVLTVQSPDTKETPAKIVIEKSAEKTDSILSQKIRQLSLEKTPEKLRAKLEVRNTK